ncbi:L,D-transpeptidase [Mesorhizobium sp. SP-1A]|uniref:L,D-transpeptidase n=1 Tax=Mesorhizobium sp. SP-1A TaxID=3077840 RepID=UPI0028F71B51|nr:L,D-transpeptidase [Mesorhizobium sp. SP-1A]
MRIATSASLIHIAAAFAGSAILLAAAENTARAADSLVARISLSRQTMQVLAEGRPAFEWKVSTAGSGFVTPTGSFRPTRMHEIWYSKKYDNAPMPHAVFFSGGYAVHGTSQIARLGRPASHGCVRLHPDAAADFYELVEAFGPTHTRIMIVR